MPTGDLRSQPPGGLHRQPGASVRHVRHFVEDDYDQAVAAVEEPVRLEPRERGQQARERLLEDKIDVTRWMVDYFESTFSGSS